MYNSPGFSIHGVHHHFGWDLIKTQILAKPRFTEPGAVAHHLSVDGYEVTTVIGEYGRRDNR